MDAYVAIEEAIVIQKNLQTIIIQNDSQLVVNFILAKIAVPKEITNLIEDNIKILSSLFKDVRINYCNRLCNSDIDTTAKSIYV